MIPDIRALAELAIQTADRSHLEPPAMEPTTFRRPNPLAAIRVTCYVYKNVTLLDNIRPIVRVREYDRQKPWVVAMLAEEKAYRQALGIWSANIIEERLEHCLEMVAHHDGAKMEVRKSSDTRTLPRNPGVNIQNGMA